MPTQLQGFNVPVRARYGLAANVPAMPVGEIGWDVDVKTLRIGDSTATPPRIMSTKSVGVFNFETVSSFTAGGVTIGGGLVDGVDVSALNQTSGLLVRRGDGIFGASAVASADASLLVGNGNGAANEPVNVQINPDSDLLAGLRRSFESSDESIVIENGGAADLGPVELRVNEDVYGLDPWYVFGVCTGAANAYTAGPTAGSQVPKRLTTGLTMMMTPSASNTSASTINAFALGAKFVLRWNGDAIEADDILLGKPTAFYYRSTSNAGAGAWHILPWDMVDEGAPVVDGEEWKNLPIFPTIETSDLKLIVQNNNNGTLTVGAAQSVLWRGWQRVNTDTFSLAERTVAHVANKTYHLRYSRTLGFSLKDLSSVIYNPSAAAETIAGFDSTFDDMLVALITTDGANAATIITLANSWRLQGEVSGAPRSIVFPSGPEVDHFYNFTLALGRTPRAHLASMDPAANSYDSDYSIRPELIQRTAMRVYSWSWHHGYNMQSPGFKFNLEA